MMSFSDEFRNPDSRCALLRGGRRILHDGFKCNYLNPVFIEKENNNTNNEPLRRNSKQGGRMAGDRL